MSTKNISPSKLKKCNSIFRLGEYVVAFTGCVHIFRTDGSYVASVRTRSFPLKIIRLRGHNVLIACRKVYYYISLENGEILWEAARFKETLVTTPYFCSFGDNATVYDIYKYEDKLLVAVILPEERQIETFELPRTGGISDFSCDDDGMLRFLQYRYYSDSPTAVDTDPQCRMFRWQLLQVAKNHQVTELYSEEECVIPSDPEGNIAIPEYYRNGCILFHDLTVLNLHTMKRFDLLENDTDPRHPAESFFLDYDKQQNYLAVTYLSDLHAEIIDCSAKKRIAQFPRADLSLSVGCIVDDEYWVGTYSGIIRRPIKASGAKDGSA